MRSLKDIRESKVPRTPKKMNMKKLFRRNQIIITTLAVMIAAAGYLNYAGKQEMASGTDVYEAGVTDISDEDILAENQALTGDPGNYQEIASLDNDPNDESLAAQETDGSGSAVASNQEGGYFGAFLYHYRLCAGRIGAGFFSDQECDGLC